MADTITVLDGIQFTKPDTADVWTYDSAVESVSSIPVILPADISAARVIFNAAKATAAARYHCRVKLTKMTAIGTITKTENTQIMEWTTVTTPEVLDSGNADVSGAYSATLHIDVAVSSTAAVTVAMEIIVQLRKEAALDEWSTLTLYNSPIGTGVKSDFAAEEAAAQTVLSIANPATGGLDNIGKHIFLEDTATIAQCEIAFLVSQSGD
jgi:hypothetical protein